MNTIFNFFKFEVKRFFCLRNVIIMTILTITALVFIRIGTQKYNAMQEEKEIFKKIEKAKISNYVNYRQYGAYGFRVILEPHSFITFCSNSSGIPEVNAFIDSSERLNINSSLIGKNMVKQNRYGFTDFSGILLFFLTLLSALYGYEGSNNREYLKTLSSLSGQKTAFFSLMLSRIVIISIFNTVQICLAVMFSALDGVHIPVNRYLFIFYILMVGVPVFFFLLGSAFTKIRPKITGIVFLIICWFLILFAVPAAVNGFFEVKSNHIKPQYQLELRKFEKFSEFEQRAIKNKITYKYGEKLTESVKKTVLSYWNNEFKKLQEMEKEMYKDMRTTVLNYQWASIIFPTTFYLSVNEEISSRGYDNLLDFYLYTIDLKAGFVKYYIDKLYFENFSKVESFIKGDENVFQAVPRIPVTFLPGILFMLFQILLLLRLNYSFYKKKLYQLSEEKEEDLPIKVIKLSMGEHRIFQSFGSLLVDRLYNLFSGKTREILEIGRPPKIYLNNIDLAKTPFNGKFLFLCSPDSLPGDIRGKDLFMFISDVNRCSKEKREDIYKRLNIARIENKKISRLKKSEKASLLCSIALMSSKDVYLFYDTVRLMPMSVTAQFANLLDELTAVGKLVVYLSPETAINEHADEEFSHFYDRTKSWDTMLVYSKN